MMMKSKGRNMKTEDMNNKPSFFKILSRDLSSNNVTRIPPKFVSTLKYFSSKATLRVSSGCSWSIRLKKTREGVFMREGWEKFLQDNSLGDKEFLIFTYEGNMCFTVKIFKKNCLEWLDLPDPCHVKTGEYPADRRYEKLGDFAEVKVEEVDEESETEIWGNTNERTSGFHGGNDSSSSGFPQFVTKMTKTYLRSTSMVVPKLFATGYLPRGKTKLVLVDLEGKHWEVVYNDDHRILSSGWSRFVRGNKLKIGDTCKFTLVAPQEMQVHITRLEAEEEE